ncbi:hypothetical protein [Lewinella sp. LCG006]|uniref:hypothetical protein n=1 Tax=Lewinella sp. LCG006 TaxID=3231911 RepID=UPI00346048AC
MVDQFLNHGNKKIAIYGLLMFVVGLVIAFLADDFLIPGVLMIVGMEVVFLELVRKYLIKKSSIKILAYTILVFSILNFLRHNVFFIVVSRISELYKNDPDFNWFLVTEFIWFWVSIWILSRGFNLLFPKEEINYEEYTASKEFRVVVVLILCLLALEIPVFGIHGNFGGYLHGHGFWDAWLHIH